MHLEFSDIISWSAIFFGCNFILFAILIHFRFKIGDIAVSLIAHVFTTSFLGVVVGIIGLIFS